MGKNAAIIEKNYFSPTVFPDERKRAVQKVAFLIVDGIEGTAMLTLRKMLEDVGAIVIYIAPFQGPITTAEGVVLQSWLTLENASNMLFDALVLPDGSFSIDVLSAYKLTKVFITNQYRNGKIILAIGASRRLLDSAALSPKYSYSNEPDAVVLSESKDIMSYGNFFIDIMAWH